MADTNKSVSSRPFILQRSLLARADAGFEPARRRQRLWIRWIRESINALLPVAGVGGDIASARLAHQRGVPGPLAGASIVVDTTVGVATQLVFVIAGVTLLVSRSSEHAAVPVAWAVSMGIGVFVAVIAIFVLVQHRRMFVVFANLANRLSR